MTRFSRASIGLRTPNGGPGDLDPRKVAGIALHWPAMTKPLRGVVNVKRALVGWQAFHMDDRGWSDIAYQEAVDQDGNSYRLRGFGQNAAGEMSGANGDRDANERYGALLLVLAPGEHPTPAMMATARRRIAAFQQLYPRGSKVVGHQDVRPEPTSCPGPIVQQLIREGRFS